MDIRKLLLYFAVAMLGGLIWMTWQKDYPPKSVQQAQQQSAAQKKATTPESFTPPSFQKKTQPATKAKTPNTPSQSVPATNTANTVSIKTDVLDVKITNVGGNIVSAKLPQYPVSVKEKNTPVKILSGNPDTLSVAQSGITGSGQNKLTFSSSKKSYALSPDAKTLNVSLTAQTKNGLVVTKTFSFVRGSYAIKQTVKVTNKSGKAWKGSFFNQITHKNTTPSHFYSRSYSGAAISSHAEPYSKVSYKDLSEKNIDRNIEGGWIAIQKPYFLTAWVPKTANENHYYSQMFGDGEKGRGNVFILGYVSPAVSLAPGKAASSSSVLYVGPELEGQLNAVANGLDLTIDYGWLWFLSKPIFYVMSAIEKVVGNWGWSIVLVTFLIKLIFYPLSAKSYKSMAKMREITPRLQALRERYKDDKQALGKATMEFYKREKVSPAGGCLPMLIQIPVFIALYYVLIESVQLRQAPFIFWIQDLSTKDPYHVLPILMALSMFLQQKLSPPPPDPTQAKMMMLLPLFFLFIFWSFPAGLVLYWFTNNVLSILQQWYVMKTYDPKAQNHKSKKKKR